MNKRMVLCAGGTGGHVIPAVNYGNFMIDKGFKCILILDKRGKNYSKLFKGKIYTVSSSHLSGSLLFKARSIIQLIVGFFQSLIIIVRFKPNLFISFGSYATLMPLTVILILKIFYNCNLFLHEQNSIIGRVNKFFIAYAKICFINFEVTHKIDKKYLKKIVHAGLPLKDIELQNYKNSKKDLEKLTLFIYGGSQGSVPLINNFLLILKKIDKKYIKKIKLIVQVQKNMHNDLKIIFEEFNLNHQINEFYIDIEEILSKTDLAITRAGAGTLHDLIKHRVPSMIVPLPSSTNNHQYHNAKYLSDKNAAILIDENNFNTNININSDILMGLITDNEKRNILINELNKIHLPNANLIMLRSMYNENNK